MSRSEQVAGAPHRPTWQRRILALVTSAVLTAGVLLAGGTPAIAAPTTGVISGTVTAEGKPVAGAWVALHDATSQWETRPAEATTDSKGNYTLTDVPPGSYKVMFDAFTSNTAEQWWKNSTSFSTATPIVVTAGGTVTGISAALVAGSTISGNVKSAGTPGLNLANLTVTAEGPDGQVGHAFTDASGNYTIAGLVAGNYTLEFRDYTGVYASQWWSGKSSREQATKFAVAAGSSLTGKNAALPPAATVSGTVKGAGSPAVNLESVSVSVTSETGQYGYATTDASGNYTVGGLAAGTYSVRFDAFDSGFVSQWWDGKSSEATSTKLVLAAGQKSVANATLPKGASISGNIKGAGSTSVNLAGVGVQISDEVSGHWADAETDANGNYTAKGLPAGNYTIRFTTEYSTLNYVSAWWNSSASTAEPTPVPVAAGQAVAGKNAVLAVGSKISGNVKGAGSPPTNLAGVQVTAYPQTGDRGPLFATTDSVGNYTILGLPAGDYSLAFEAGQSRLNFVSQWWGAAANEEAPLITLPSGGSSTGKNVVMAKGGTISGNVKSAASPIHNLENVYVNVNSGNMIGSQYAPTDANGNYTVYGLAAGSHTVEFDYYDGVTQRQFASQWWNGATLRSAATPVTVTVGKDVGGINAALAEGAEITGLVTDAAGNSLADVIVPMWQKDGSGWINIGAAFTDSDGKYRYHGMNAGTYKVGFTDSENDEYWNQVLTGNVYAAQFFSGKSTFAAADAITLGAGKTVTNATVVLNKKGVAAKPLTAAPIPTIGGIAQIGKILTASAGTWSPAPVALEYQWNRDGVAIAGANAATYTLVTADLGKKITVAVTGTKPGYTTESKTSAATAAVIAAATPELPPLTATPIPTIAGTTTVGEVLTVSAGTWAPATVTLTYQWNRDGVAISGATSTTYTLVAADSGKKISVSVTGTKPGNATATMTSVVTATVIEEVKTFTTTPAPVVTGTPEVGRTLTAAAGSWTPSPDSLAFQWNRDGAIIPGATASKFALSTADLGKKITVTVTAAKAGYTTVDRTSASSPVIVEATAGKPDVTRSSGDDRYTTAVKISEVYEPGVPVVYVATGGMFPDALAAAPAAAKQGGPLLLTTDSSLPALVKAEIVRLKPKKIVVVGGETAVSASVYKQLGELTPSIRRDSGSDRFETARTIVKNAFGTSGSTTAFVATARNFPDALAASAAAGAAGAPVVLVDGEASDVDAPTKKLLADLKVSTISIAGGTTVVSAKMEASLKSIMGNTKVTRLSGDDRYQTSGAINRASFTSSDSIYLAVGTGYADALAGAALAGKNKAPLYTVQGHCVPSFVLADITTLGATKVVLLGGTNALGVGVEKLTPCSY